jgi:hypothetical protein
LAAVAAQALQKGMEVPRPLIVPADELAQSRTQPAPEALPVHPVDWPCG